MSSGALGRRYAKALFDLAEEAKQTDKIGRDLADLKVSWEGSEELQNVVENPAVGAEARKQLLTTLATRLGLHAIVKNTVFLLSDRRRLRHIPEIVDAYEELAEQKAGRVRAEVITATPMPERYYMQLQKTLEATTGKKVVIVKKQDPSIIGGVVTKIGDRVLDGSIKNRLDELREELLA